MKLTKSKLKRIIKEELTKALEEGYGYSEQHWQKLSHPDYEQSGIEQIPGGTPGHVRKRMVLSPEAAERRRWERKVEEDKEYKKGYKDAQSGAKLPSNESDAYKKGWNRGKEDTSAAADAKAKWDADEKWEKYARGQRHAHGPDAMKPVDPEIFNKPIGRKKTGLSRKLPWNKEE